MNNLASFEIIIGVKGRFHYPWVPLPGHCLHFLLSNDFPVIFQVYMNIHDYANEIIFI